MSNATTEPQYSEFFTRAVKHTLVAEGFFSDFSWDPGGATKYGITAALAKRYGYNVRDLTVEQATRIYYQEFWVTLGLDPLSRTSWRVAVELFDTAVNCGVSRAVKIAQEALLTVFNESTVAVDGKMGPRTHAALKKVAAKYETQLVAALNGFQFTFYVWLLRNKHSAAEKSIKGWMRRLETPLS